MKLSYLIKYNNNINILNIQNAGFNEINKTQSEQQSQQEQPQQQQQMQKQPQKTITQ